MDQWSGTNSLIINQVFKKPLRHCVLAGVVFLWVTEKTLNYKATTGEVHDEGAFQLQQEYACNTQ